MKMPKEIHVIILNLIKLDLWSNQTFATQKSIETPESVANQKTAYA